MTESESIQFVRLGYTLYSLIHIITCVTARQCAPRAPTSCPDAVYRVSSTAHLAEYTTRP